MHINTVILLKNFSFGLINFVDLSTMFLFNFFTFFYLFNKKRVFSFFILGVNVFFTSMNRGGAMLCCGPAPYDYSSVSSTNLAHYGNRRLFTCEYIKSGLYKHQIGNLIQV